MPVGIAIGRGPQAVITAAQEISGRGELLGPQPGLNRAQDELERSRRGVKASGGTLAGDLRKEPGDSFDNQRFQAESNILAAAVYPEKMFIMSTDYPDEKVVAQFNPERLKESIGVDWQRFSIPGLSHQHLQYGTARNVEYRFELYFTGHIMRDTRWSPGDIAASQVAKNMASRDQIHAWMLRRRDASLGAIGDTQRLLFVWPNFISLSCVLVSAEFEYTAFNTEGVPVAFKVELLVEEIRDVVMFAEDVLLYGTRRPSGAPEVF